MLLCACVNLHASGDDIHLHNIPTECQYMAKSCLISLNNFPVEDHEDMTQLLLLLKYFSLYALNTTLLRGSLAYFPEYDKKHINAVWWKDHHQCDNCTVIYCTSPVAPMEECMFPECKHKGTLEVQKISAAVFSFQAMCWKNKQCSVVIRIPTVDSGPAWILL